MKKTTVAILFGGRSGEHEVSLVSAASILSALNRERYDVVQVGVTKEGVWVTGDGALDYLRDCRGEARDCRENVEQCFLPADPSRKCLLVTDGDRIREIPIDVAFPVIHGTFGEDGSLQGLFELADIPYAGAGVLGSSVAMDKIVQKRLHHQAGIPMVNFIWLHAAAFRHQPDKALDQVEEWLSYPVFVKPPNLGSSVGISKAGGREQLRDAIELAMRYDRKILVEQAVISPREIEVAILGDLDAVASMPGEVISSNEFYDYDAKYVDNASELSIPADLPAEISVKVRELALKAYHALDLEGFARVDFLLSRDSKEIYVNEINTIPGFTSISMYPKLFEAAGIEYPVLLDRIIALAFDRHREKQALRRSFTPKEQWHK